MSIRPADAGEFKRLPTNVVPRNYALALQPDLTGFTFAGTVDVTVEVVESTSVVLLNSIDLDISSAVFKCGDKALGATVALDTATEVATLTCEESLPVGTALLSMAFTGTLNDQMKGFYRSMYVQDGEERYAAVTQFEATDARRCFPCWDEPAVKATFDVTLTVPVDRVALSNMPVAEERASADGALKTLVFERTPIMSTYLVAFVVGEFDSVEATTSGGRILVRVWTPVGKKEQGNFALDVAVRTLPYYEEWFGVEYPLPKADLVAISSFAAGAMENWGLITYRETALLMDPASSSAHSKQWIALVVGHELAHQWFGNIVTMEWWTSLWLNEGFASWIEYLCVDHCFPEWDIWTQFLYQDMSRALSLDALESSHPVEVPVGHPAEVDEIFDIISYSKGCSLIRTLHGFLGEEVFRKALNAYLNKHKYQNTVTEDLWAALNEASGEPVGELMDTWTKKMGYPLLTVQREGSKLTVQQRRFLASKEATTDETWIVPLSLRSGAGKELRHTMRGRSETIDISSVVEGVAPADDWIKLNVNQTGFYRVRYDTAMLDSLVAALKAGAIESATDRLGIQSDVFALARCSLGSTVDVLKLFRAYEQETDYTVWADISSNFGSVRALLSHRPCREAVDAYARKLFRPTAERLGWEKRDGESHLDSMLRGLALGALGRAGDQATIDEATARLKAFASGDCNIPADLRGVVYGVALSHGDTAIYDLIMSIFEKTDLQEERERCMRSLGNAPTAELLKRTLDFSLSSKVRSQDAVFVIAGVAANPKGRDLAWEFLKQNWTKLVETYNGRFLLSRVVSACVSSFITEEEEAAVRCFFDANPSPAIKRALDQGLETVQNNRSWLARDGDALVSFLEGDK